MEPRLQGHCQSPPRDEAEEPAERGGRAKRAKLCRRYDNLPREGTDSEGHVWALVPDPRAEGAHYNGFDGTGYEGDSNLNPNPNPNPNPKPNPDPNPNTNPNPNPNPTPYPEHQPSP